MMKRILEPQTDFDESVITAEAEPNYIPGLDGIRALAVSLVTVSHIGFGDFVPGGFGVTVFFFLSGFLITRLLLAEIRRTKTIRLRQFIARRFLRLLPALFVMLGTTAVAYLIIGHPILTRQIVGALTYTMNYVKAYMPMTYDEQVWWQHLWSLAVEEHFYLLFPPILLALKTTLRRAIWFCLAVIIGCSLWRSALWNVFEVTWVHNYVMTDARIDSIAWGCLLSLILEIRHGLVDRLVGWIPFGIGCALLLFCFGYRNFEFRYTWRFSLQGAGLFLMFANLYGWVALQPIATKLLEVRPLRWLGKTSYGLYLWHLPAAHFTALLIEKQFGTPLFVTSALLLTVIPAALSFYLVERPFLRLRERFGSLTAAHR